MSWVQPGEVLQVCILGRLRVCRGVVEVEIAGARLRRLLVRLAGDAGSVVSAEQLLDAVWPEPEDRPAGATNALQSLISRLRRALSSAAAVQQLPGGYLLALDRPQVDLHRWADLVDAAGVALRHDKPASAADLARQALGLWRSDPLIDADGVAYAVPVLARLHQQRTQAAVVLADALLGLDSGRPGAGEGTALFEQAVVVLAELVADNPLQEVLADRLMAMLAAAGRPAEALRVYEGLRRSLADELGVDPGPQLRARHLSLLRSSTEPTGAAAVRSERSAGPGLPDLPTDRPTQLPGLLHRRPRNNLRTPLTDLVGRDRELPRIRDLLRSNRLVTVIGPGGAGKTRLSIEIAGQWAATSGAAVCMVELAPVTSPAGVAQAVSAALGVHEASVLDRRVPRPPRQTIERIIEALAPMAALLIVDNCEHLIPAAAELVDAVLAACPGVRVLATSREPLGIVGEAITVLPLLDLPPASVDAASASGYSAVQLLDRRAAAVRTGFRVHEGNVSAVVEIVRRLDGLPLAIELAAARLRVLPEAEVARRLDDRFSLLAGGNRAALPRHQTLRAVVEWSWDLLLPAERRLAERLSVFPSGATEEAAAAVCADAQLPAQLVGDLLVSLVDKSLLQVVDGPVLRYRMLETIREYGAEQLLVRAERDAAERAHAQYFAAVAAALDPLLRGHHQLGALATLRTEQDNIIAALQHLAASGDLDGAISVGLALVWPWTIMEEFGEIVSWMDLLLRHAGSSGHPWLIYVRVARALSALASGAGHPDAGSTLAREQLTPLVRQLATAPPPPVPALVILGPILAYFSGDDATGRELCDALISGDNVWVGAAVRVLRANFAENRGDTTAMREDVDTALVDAEPLGDGWLLANALNCRGWLRTIGGDPQGAIEDYERALIALAGLGGRVDDLQIHLRLAGLRLCIGDLAGARRNLAAARGDGRDEPRGADWNLLADGVTAQLLIAQGDRSAARELCDRLRSAVERMDPSWMQGHVSALTLAATAAVALVLGDVEQALQDVSTGYPIAVGVDDLPVLAHLGVAVAGIAAAKGDHRRAAALLGACARLRGGDDAADPVISWVRQQFLAADPHQLDEAFGEGRKLPVAECTAALDPAQFRASGPLAIGTQSQREEDGDQHGHPAQGPEQIVRNRSADHQTADR